MGSHGEKTAGAVHLQPLGQGLLAVLQQELGGGDYAGQARCQGTELGIVEGAACRLAGVFLGDRLDLCAQRLPGFGQCTGQCSNFADGGLPGFGKQALGETELAILALAACIAPGVRPDRVQRHARQCGQVGLEVAAGGLHILG